MGRHILSSVSPSERFPLPKGGPQFLPPCNFPFPLGGPQCPPPSGRGQGEGPSECARSLSRERAIARFASSPLKAGVKAHLPSARKSHLVINREASSRTPLRVHRASRGTTGSPDICAVRQASPSAAPL